VGILGLRFAHACCLVLLLTLAWGPHWPFSHFGLVAPHAGLLNAGFDLADLLLVGILIGWGGALLTGQDRVVLRPPWVSGSLLLFTLAGGLAIFSAPDRAAAVRFAVRSGGLAVLYLYLHRTIATRRLTPATLACWLAPGLGLNGLLAIAQAIHQNPLGLSWLDEPAMLRSTSGTAVVLVHGARILRPYGVLPHPNVLGGLLAAGLPLVIGLLSGTDQAGSVQPARWKLPAMAPRETLALLHISLMAAGLLLSLSRSAWLGLLGGGLYLIIWRTAGRRSLPWRGSLAGMVMMLTFAVLLPAEFQAVVVRLQPESNRLEQASIAQRVSLLEISFKVIAWRPLTGVGGDNFARAAGQFLPSSADSQTSLPVHNTYLLAQAELGPLGAVPWTILMLTPLLGLARYRWTRRPTHGAPRANAAREVTLPWERRASRKAEVSRSKNGGAGLSVRGRRPRSLQAHALEPQQAGARWRALAGCSLMVVAVAGMLDFYIWVNEPVAVLWIVALTLFTAS